MPAGAGMPRIGSPVGGIFDSRSDATAGHRLVIEARDDMQVGVEPALIVPAERVAVGSEPLVQLGSYEKQKFPRSLPATLASGPATSSGRWPQRAEPTGRTPPGR